MPGLAGRRVPVKLAVVPAAFVAAIVLSAGLGLLSSPQMWTHGVLIIPHLLWPLWGLALGFAAYAYHLRRRGACATCGRDG